MPQGNWLRFKNEQNSLYIPFVVYADFECISKPTESCQPTSEASYSEVYQKHEPYNFCYYICEAHGFYKPPVVYRGPNAENVFIKKIMKEAEDIYEIYQKPKPMSALSEEQIRKYEHAAICYLCGDEFTVANWKVHDHCHLTGAYRGPAHNQCNIKLKVPHFLPVIFHNLSGYDAHLFIKELAIDDRNLNVIAENTEKYISFSKKVKGRFSVRFLDSFRFMASSIEKLSGNLTPEQFVHINSSFSKSQAALLLRKGVFPYDYISDINKLEETCLPAKEAFYSHLNEESISGTEYEHAKNVWNEFNIQTLGEYSDLYVEIDFLLLTDIFENFREVCMETYHLDPAWYYTSPGLSWDAMLKVTKTEIELLTDYDMFLMVEKGIRGGISQCSNRYAVANNKYMFEYDAALPSKYLLYLDANNLYGLSYEPTFATPKFQVGRISQYNIDITKVPSNSSIGYIIEVDLEYPEQLHNIHSDLPLTSETRAPPGCKENRFLTTLNNKTKYVNHELFSVKMNKLALSPYDKKRYILDNRINALTFGHYKISYYGPILMCCAPH
ncbi:uncharacterized protein LOC118204561 [Stegodyphus dumicola]|uniref:uncharacterized protein LOC118204561 n=1 Tax=Stegodyphus dumicola TaxID=202533 RepID=UPI0015AD1F8B|nr:uncharacterized protein LOC118204561 [Stegodyphus dumicola]